MGLFKPYSIRRTRLNDFLRTHVSARRPSRPSFGDPTRRPAAPTRKATARAPPGSTEQNARFLAFV